MIPSAKYCNSILQIIITSQIVASYCGYNSRDVARTGDRKLSPQYYNKQNRSLASYKQMIEVKVFLLNPSPLSPLRFLIRLDEGALGKIHKRWPPDQERSNPPLRCCCKPLRPPSIPLPPRSPRVLPALSRDPKLPPIPFSMLEKLLPPLSIGTMPWVPP